MEVLAANRIPNQNLPSDDEHKSIPKYRDRPRHSRFTPYLPAYRRRHLITIYDNKDYPLQRGSYLEQRRPVPPPLYHARSATEPALGANSFAQYLNTNSQSSLTTAMERFNIAEGSSTSSGSFIFTSDQPHKGASSPLESKNLDDRTALSIAHHITSVISGVSFYQSPLCTDWWKSQRLVQISQIVLENPTVDVTSRRALVVFIQRLSESAGVYPSPYTLEGVRRMSLKPIGRGTFGTVYRGIYQGRDVCLKALKQSRRTTHFQLSQAVASEAILWRQLNHPNVLPFYGVCNLDIGLCLVSPWMPQGDLREYIWGPVAPEERLLMARDVAEGLKYLHSYDIIHGLLDGKNVLIDGAGRARIANFGLTSINDPSFLSSQTWAVLSKADDIYAWGCICYELYIGEVPYKGSRFDARKLCNEMPKRPDHNSPAWIHGLTQEMWSFMRNTWKAELDERPDAAEVVDKVSEMIERDFRPEEGHEQEPEANFISHWCRDLAVVLGRQKYKAPSLDEVQELLQMDIPIGESLTEQGNVPFTSESKVLSPFPASSSESSVHTNNNWEEFTDQTSKQDRDHLYPSSSDHRSSSRTPTTLGLLHPTATSSRSPSSPGSNDDGPQSISVLNRSLFKPGSSSYSPPLQDSSNSRMIGLPQSPVPCRLASHGIGVQETRQFFAETALDFVNRHKKELKGYLFKLGYEGEYIIQVGFHEELLRHGVRQEMIVFTFFSDFKPSEAEAADVLDKACAPLIVAIQSPNQNFCIPLELNGLQSEESVGPLSSSWGTVSDEITTINSSKSGGQEAQNVNGQLAAGSSKDNGRAGDQDETQGDGDEDSDKGEGEDGDEIQDTPELNTGLKYNKPARRSLANHLISGIWVPSNPPSLGPEYKFSLEFDFLIEDSINLEGGDPPVDERLQRTWLGPWARVNLASVGTSSRPTKIYTVRTIEIKITAAPKSTETLYYYPRSKHAEADKVTIKAETKANNRGAGHLGVTDPFLSFHHENGETESKALEYNRWSVHSDIWPQQEGTVFTSQFDHNSAFSSVCSENSIPGPRIGYGYNSEGEQRRTIGISMKVLWSSTATPERPRALLDIIRSIATRARGSQIGTSTQPLMFANFEQELSFEVDLAKLEPGSARMEDPNIIDQVERADLTGDKKSLPEDMRKVHQTFEIEMHRAIRGEIKGKKKIRFELDSRYNIDTSLFRNIGSLD